MQKRICHQVRRSGCKATRQSALYKLNKVALLLQPFGPFDDDVPLQLDICHSVQKPSQIDRHKKS